MTHIPAHQPTSSTPAPEQRVDRELTDIELEQIVAGSDGPGYRGVGVSVGFGGGGFGRPGFGYGGFGGPGFGYGRGRYGRW
ncbi:hypothetical protein [Tuwongella immobilis]|uniref:Uncharacterized protein n=1 Tax=Tuwongella immobilis TaxID=692036 RepID=A0A6C2YSD2_9BACT|nr:hypothetical protein [Tuwongella immobilis]VIP04588.1 unnamed protein product [Tuwongella immobilis]VTS06537.1 unnamed protein product [Tuwongella immobilis]